MRIYLIRHGESLGNVDKSVHRTMADHAIPLSDLGCLQALETSLFLRQHLLGQNLIPRIWTSPYARTRQTAAIIQKECESWGVIRDRREHILLSEQQFGLFDGLDDAELSEKYPAEHAHYNKCERFEGRFWARMPLGESRFDVCTRVHQAFGTFHRDAAKHGIDDIIVVAHGTTIRAFVMMWCHLPFEWFEAERNPPNCSIRLLNDGEDRGYIYIPRTG